MGCHQATVTVKAGGRCISEPSLAKFEYHINIARQAAVSKDR